MAGDIQKQFGKSILGDSDIVIDNIRKTTINYVNFQQKELVQQEQAVILSYLNGCHQKEACINIENEVKHVSNIVFDALFIFKDL